MVEASKREKRRRSPSSDDNHHRETEVDPHGDNLFFVYNKTLYIYSVFLNLVRFFFAGR